MATARIWVTIQQFHPYLADRNIDWDGALVKALPKIRAASTQQDLQAAIATMLSQLNDPLTRVLRSDEATPSVSQAVTAPYTSLLRTATTVSFVTSSASIEQTSVIEAGGLRVLVRLSEAGTPKSPVNPVALIPQTDPYPGTEQRILAAIKVWGTIRYFFAYKDLMDEDWGDIFANYLPKFIAAKDALDYNLTLADLLTHLTDTNTAPHSKTLDAYFGEVPTGLRIRLLDKYPIIVQVLDPAAIANGIRPGDILKRVGTEGITDRFRRFVQYVPASTPQRSGFDTVQTITNGPEGSDVELTIEDAKGEAHPIKLARHSTSAPQRTTEAVRILSGNIAYIDLDRLTAADAEKVFAQVKDTKAIIFDLRGPHAPAARTLVCHLTSNSGVAEALVTTPIALHPDIASASIVTETSSTFQVRALPAPAAPLYKGKTFALIDERTIGEAEYAGLEFEAAAKTEFVGEPTAGVESATASLTLPGGITLTYSTQDVRHGNGGKLQRLGLQPTIPAATTAKGLRAGKDEALDAAVEHILVQK